MTLDKIRTGTGRKLRTESLQETALPIPYDAAAMAGATVLGTDGKLYASVKNSAGVYEWSNALLVTDKGVGIRAPDYVATFAGLVLGGQVTSTGQATGPARLLLVPFRDPSPSLEGNILARIDFGSRNEVALSDREIATPASISANAIKDQWGADSKPTSLRFSATAANTLNRTLRFQLEADGAIIFSNALGNEIGRFSTAGNLLLGNTTGTERLDVTGNIKASGALIGSTLQTTGQSARTQALVETALPIALDPTTVPGASVLGADGEIYQSLKSLPSGPYEWSRVLYRNAAGSVLINIDQINAANGLLALAGKVTAFQDTGPARFLLIPENDPSAALTGNVIGRIDFCSRGIRVSSTQLDSPVTIRAHTNDEVWSGNSRPTGLRVHCTAANASGHSSRVELQPNGQLDVNNALGQNHVRITDSGNVLINNTTGTERLSVTGNIQLTNTADSYKVGTNNVVGARKTGWAAPTGTATRTTFATTTVTTEQLAERVKALIDDLTSHGLIGT